MAGGYNNLGPNSGGIKVGVIGGGHDGDPPQDQSSNQKILNPTLHGDGVNLDHLMQSGLSLTPSQFGQQSFPGALDPGTVIYYLAQEGMNGGIILGMANMLKDGAQGSTGSGTPLGGRNLQKLRQTKLNINAPPKVQQTTERGAKVKKPQETGEQHRLELLDGLPIHGALFQMAGFRLPEMPNVPTAKKKGSQMMNQDIMEKLGGQLQSMGGLFQGLLGKGGGGPSSNFGNFAGNFGTGPYDKSAGYTYTNGETVFFQDQDNRLLRPEESKANTSNGPGTVGWGNTGVNRMEQIYKKVPKHVATALRNLTILSQGSEGTEPMGFIPGNIVHPETYMNNAETLLSQVRNIDDLMNVMQRLEYDTSLFGQEKLEPVIVTTNSAWGPATKTYYPNGFVTVTLTESAQNNYNNFIEIFANNQLSPGFTSLPADAIVTTNNVTLIISEEASANVENAKFTILKPDRNDPTTYATTKATFYTIPEKTNYFQEKIVVEIEPGEEPVNYVLQNPYAMYSLIVYAGTGDIPNYVVNTRVSGGSGSDKELILNVDYTARDGKSITILTPTDYPVGTIFTIIGKRESAIPISVGGGGAGGGGAGTGGSGSGGGSSGQNIMGQMFGKSSGIMKELMQRLPRQGESESQKMTQKLNQDQTSQKLMEIAKKTINGGDPLMKNLFE